MESYKCAEQKRSANSETRRLVIYLFVINKDYEYKYYHLIV